MSPSDLTPEELSLLQPPAQTSNTAGTRASTTCPQPPRFTSADSTPGVSPQQLVAFESFHQEVAGRFADALSRELQRLVEVELVRVESMAYSQYACGRSNPTCYVVLDAAPLRTALALDLHPTLLYPVLDCMLGGGRQPCALPERPPTELEQRLAQRVVRILIDELHDAWEPLLAVDLSLARIESHAQRVRVVGPADPVLAVTFKVQVADQLGGLSLCLPHRAIGILLDKLSVGEFPGAGPGAAEDLDEDDRELVVYFEAEPISHGQLEDLQPGQVLLSDVDVDGLVELSLDGTPMGHAKPGVVDGHRAVVVTPPS